MALLPSASAGLVVFARPSSVKRLATPEEMDWVYFAIFVALSSGFGGGMVGWMVGEWCGDEWLTSGAGKGGEFKVVDD